MKEIYSQIRLLMRKRQLFTAIVIVMAMGMGMTGALMTTIGWTTAVIAAIVAMALLTVIAAITMVLQSKEIEYQVTALLKVIMLVAKLLLKIMKNLLLTIISNQSATPRTINKLSRYLFTEETQAILGDLIQIELKTKNSPLRKKIKIIYLVINIFIGTRIIPFFENISLPNEKRN